MFEVKFGRKHEPSQTFSKSDNAIAIRTRSTHSLRNEPVMSSMAAEVEDGDCILAFPEFGVEVYRVPTGAGARSVPERKQSLRAMPDVRFAGSVLVDSQTGEPVVYTENLFIKFVDEAEPDDCRSAIREAGLTLKKELKYAVNAFFVSAPDGTGTEIFNQALSLLNRDDVEYCHPELLRQRKLHQIFPQQWHLKSTIVNGSQVSASANVEAAHRIATGEGIVIAVIDDGVDIDHPEFSSSGKIVAPRDATLRIDDPRPKDPNIFFSEMHGTACAGVACADGKEGASGVAPNAKLMPIRLSLSSGLGSLQEAEAFEWAADNGADVISCSWGPEDGSWGNPNDPLHNRFVPIAPMTKLAIDYAITQGRDGKGCVVLFAAGNGNESVENDGYASYEKVIAVAACNDTGKRSVYSDFGESVWCSFPSNDRESVRLDHPRPITPGIWTTDRVGRHGYNNGQLILGDEDGNFTNSFGGTSSSCPGAAGVAALVLSVNPELKGHEVRDILRRACDRIDPQGGEYDDNGHSKLYGYGRLNAETAVQLAQPTPRDRVLISRTFNKPLPDLQKVSVSLDVGNAESIEDLSVHVDILHTFIGDLVVSLVPPAALNAGEIVLHNRQGGATHNLKREYDISSTPELGAFRGKSVRGTWQLKIEDKALRDIGTLRQFGLELDFE